MNSMKFSGYTSHNQLFDAELFLQLISFPIYQVGRQFLSGKLKELFCDVIARGNWLCSREGHLNVKSMGGSSWLLL